jgi:DNA polymerase III epsilon subunit-like protein
MTDYTHDIVSTTRGITKHGDPMWECETAQGDKLFIFTSNRNKPTLWRDSGWGSDLIQMELEETLLWRTTPIKVNAVKSGNFFNIMSVQPKPDNAKPDDMTTIDTPSPDLHKPNIKSVLGWLSKAPVTIFDLETTGTNTSLDEIMSIAYVKWGTGSKDSHSWNGQTMLIKPYNPDRALIKGKDGKCAIDIHGITLDKVAEQPTFTTLYNKINREMRFTHWVCWNSDYDVNLIDSLCMRNGLPIIPRLSVTCAMKLISPLMNEWDFRRNSFKWAKLEDVASHYGIDATGAHDAYADVCMTRDVMNYVLENEV